MSSGPKPGPERQAQIQIKVSDEILGGSYANLLLVSHTREEFVLDFLMVAPPAGAVTARIILSPGHVKRVVAALSENVRKYEEAHGTILAAQEPQGKIGFN